MTFGMRVAVEVVPLLVASLCQRKAFSSPFVCLGCLPILQVRLKFARPFFVCGIFSFWYRFRGQQGLLLLLELADALLQPFQVRFAIVRRVAAGLWTRLRWWRRFAAL